MIAGQKVVCVNDAFHPAVLQLYTQLPIRDEIYTLRDICSGRNLETGEYEILVTLCEIHNPDDPRPTPSGKSPGELGFRADRFAPLETETETNHEYGTMPLQFA